MKYVTVTALILSKHVFSFHKIFSTRNFERINSVSSSSSIFINKYRSWTSINLNSVMESTYNDMERINLKRYLETQDLDSELSEVIECVAKSCSDVSKILSRLSIIETALDETNLEEKRQTWNIHGENQKPMDVLANKIFIDNLDGSVAAIASEEEDDIIYSSSKIKRYEIAFDPLDGSSNLDVNIPTGSIFGVSLHTPEKPFSSNGRALVAAGYILYSSSTEFVLSIGLSGSQSAAIFALDPLLDKNDFDATERFILTRSNLTCPTNGPYYSLNEAREPDWPSGLRRWISDAKRGKTKSKIIYSSRYVCSLCADVHRTLLKGGWAGNPRPHLRLLYEAAPLAYVAEAFGGKGSDGNMNILDIVPLSYHDRIPVFIGSKGDIEELEYYGDVQQNATSYKS